jgi:hypothetical protein
MRVSHQALQEVEEALRAYQNEVESSKRLAPSTKRTYLSHSAEFVRWLKGDFVPGAKK